ncbi:hypothetical protein BpHYR1_028737 [Brachionus plicatilis]|uniref:Uncharacterized protein n=1 Tax=Brachionus plicatilis TaxID=10195 RepID=A0A3M7QWB6_BRAPC|nr:hypothetical protein BpHYR1_028737 [Brachionus plicatilis]
MDMIYVDSDKKQLIPQTMDRVPTITSRDITPNSPKSRQQRRTIFYNTEPRLKVQYTKNIITFEQYFEKLAGHIVDPYEAVKIKFDLDDEVKDEIETGKKRKRKVVFENPLKNQEFMDRIDFINFNIWPKPQVQISNFFSIEMFTVLKTQIHIYNNFIVKYQPVRKDLFDALQLYTS